MKEKVFVSRVVAVECKYDSSRDLSEVDQFGALDLREAYVNGVVPGNVPFDDTMFNGVVEPRTLMNRSLDVFESLRQAEYVRSRLDAASEERRKSAEKALEAANAARAVAAPAPAQSGDFIQSATV